MREHPTLNVQRPILREAPQPSLNVASCRNLSLTTLASRVEFRSGLSSGFKRIEPHTIAWSYANSSGVRNTRKDQRTGHRQREHPGVPHLDTLSRN